MLPPCSRTDQGLKELWRILPERCPDGQLGKGQQQQQQQQQA